MRLLSRRAVMMILNAMKSVYCAFTNLMCTVWGSLKMYEQRMKER